MLPFSNAAKFSEQLVSDVRSMISYLGYVVAFGGYRRCLSVAVTAVSWAV